MAPRSRRRRCVSLSSTRCRTAAAARRPGHFRDPGLPPAGPFRGRFCPRHRLTSTVFDNTRERASDERLLRKPRRAGRGAAPLPHRPPRRPRGQRASTSQRLPYATRILLENLLRREDGASVTADRHRGGRQLGSRRPSRRSEIAFMPARVLLQDFTGVPAVVDLAAMRDAMARAGRRPGQDQPAAAGRAGDRPLGAGRRVRHGRRPS